MAISENTTAQSGVSRSASIPKLAPARISLTPKEKTNADIDTGGE